MDKSKYTQSVWNNKIYNLREKENIGVKPEQEYVRSGQMVIGARLQSILLQAGVAKWKSLLMSALYDWGLLPVHEFSQARRLGG